MAWFAVHVVMRISSPEGTREPIAVWENCILVQAGSHDSAREEGAKIGALESTASGDSMKWAGRPARWDFVGVRKVQIVDAEAFQHGLEISHMEYEVASQGALTALAAGDPVELTYVE